jgi:hypothetical protein
VLSDLYALGVTECDNMLMLVSQHFFLARVTWDRCYDFKNIYAEKFSEKFGVFDSTKLNYAKF